VAANRAVADSPAPILAYAAGLMSGQLRLNIFTFGARSKVDRMLTRIRHAAHFKRVLQDVKERAEHPQQAVALRQNRLNLQFDPR
jgi:hypothetical protein